MKKTILDKISHSVPVTDAELSWLYFDASLEEISAMAGAAKTRRFAVDEASYLIMAIVNYTNICVAKCDYCSFYKLPHEKGGYLLSFDEVAGKISALLSYGGTLVSFNGGFHPKLKIHDYAAFFERVHATFPALSFFEMTVAEFMFACKNSRISYDEGAQILKGAGTQWITGGGAEILDDGFRRRHSPGKYKVADYFAAQKAILKAGIGSTATMVIGFDETFEERANHLRALRQFQFECQNELGRGLKSFLCWTYKPYNNAFGGQEIDGEAYLRWLGIARIYLNNFEHIRTSVLTKNELALEGLRYGANDFDLPTEDEVTEKAGATISHDFERILDCARSKGIRLHHRKPFEP